MKITKWWRTRRQLPETRRGDTMIEVLLASAIFGFVSLLTITLMNSGLRISQANLQMTMARNEISAQAEALRYIHNAYISSPSDSTTWNQYKNLWEQLVAGAVSSDESLDPEDGLSCAEIYEGSQAYVSNDSFVINTYALQLTSTSDFSNVLIKNSGANVGKLAETETYPYLEFNETYGTVEQANGIWVNVKKSDNSASNGEPMYYEFYINTCWYSVNGTAPTSLDTVIRLYNPDAWS